MLKHVLFASAALALLAAPSLAATTTINGTVPALCSALTDPLPITISDLVDTATGVAKVASVTGIPSPLAGAWCNGGHNSIDVAITKLTTAAAAPAGFTNSIDYVLTQAPLGSVDTAMDPLISSLPMNTPFIVPAGVTGSVTTEAGSAKLVAGDYQATITVTLTAGL